MKSQKVDILKSKYREGGLKEIFYSIQRYLKKNSPAKKITSLFYNLQTNLKYNRTLTSSSSDLIYVSPQKIIYRQSPPFFLHLSPSYSYVFPGDWDLRKKSEHNNCSRKNRCIKPFNEYYLYKSFKRHFKENVPWEETEFYRKKMKKIDRYPSSHPKYGTKQKFRNNYLSKIDLLYENIKENGYKSQKELKELEENSQSEIPYIHSSIKETSHEVLVNIGRDGKIIFDDGRHRLSIAKILGIKEIPVKVMVRHSKWQKTKRKIENSSSLKKLNKEEKEKIGHPDIQKAKE